MKAHPGLLYYDVRWIGFILYDDIELAYDLYYDRSVLSAGNSFNSHYTPWLI